MANFADRQDSSVATMDFQFDTIDFGKDLPKWHRQWGDIKREYESQWISNIHFARGNHFLRASRGGAIGGRDPSQDRWPHLHDNRIRPAMVKYIGRLVENRPIVRVDATNGDRESRNAAKVGTKFLQEFIWEEYKLKEKLQRVLAWMFTCSRGFIENTYTFDGPEDQVGRHVIEVVSPFEMFFPPDANPFDPKEGMRVYALTPERIYSRWGVAVNADADIEISEHHLQLQRNLGLDGHQRDAKLALVYEYYKEPMPDSQDPRLKNGIHAVYAGRHNPVKLHEAYDIETPHRRLPWTSFIDPSAGEALWWEGRARDAVVLNRELNKTLIQITMAKDLTAMPKWWVPQGTQMSGESLTDEPGEIIHYNSVGGARPIPAAGPALPSYVMDELLYLRNSIHDIFPEVTVDQGRLPKGVNSGVSLQILNQQNATADAPALNALKTSIHDLTNKIMSEEMAFGPERRVVEVVGKSGASQVFDWYKAHLEGGYRINVGSQPDIPKDKATRMQMGSFIHGQGLWGPPGTPDAMRQYRDFIEVGVNDDAFLDEELEKSLIDNEIQMILQGVNPPTFMYYNHDLHVAGHKRWLMENMNALMSSPEGQQALAFVNQHIMGHVQMQMNMMQFSALIQNPSALQGQAEESSEKSE